MSHLLLISIGPVQDFIASARRPVDFYAGSQLLSWLAGTIAESIGRQCGFRKLVFPAASDAEDLERLKDIGVANIVLSRVDENPEEIAEQACRAAYSFLDALSDELFTPYAEHLNMETAKLQLTDLPEIHWAAVPLGNDYSAARHRLYGLLNARKATRDFQPVRWGAAAPKSSLDGTRETVLSYGTPIWARRKMGIKDGEHLSGVDLAKRLWLDREQGRGRTFKRTTHIAAGPFLAALDDDRKTSLYDSIRRMVADYGLIDGRGLPPDPAEAPELLYPNRLRELFPEPDDERAAEAANFLRRRYKSLGTREPAPYYTILMADGDRVGAAISRQDDIQSHRRLSAALAGFARQAGAIVGEHEGEPVYAGGDDVLAFVPVHTALSCAEVLSDTFRHAMEPFSDEGSPVTLSVGIVVFHLLEPLQDGLTLAREALSTAKEDAGRNALAVVIQPRSGNPLTVTGRWEQSPNLAHRLLAYALMLSENSLPGTFAYEVQRLGDYLEGAPLSSEVERILSRKEVRAPAARQIRENLQQFGADRLWREIAAARHFVAAIGTGRVKPATAAVPSPRGGAAR